MKALDSHLRLTLHALVLLLAAPFARAAEPVEKAEVGDGALVDAVKSVQGKPAPKGPFSPSSGVLLDETQIGRHRTGTAVVLHTNDIHDILKAPAQGLGGLAYVAGYANAMRQQRPDVLFVDAGDIQEKGDAMGVTSKGEASYRALASLGLDATVPGNHDFAYGLPRLLRNVQLTQIPLLCAGMEYEDNSESVFPEFLIKKIGDLRVGLIGATVRRSAHSERAVRQFDLPTLGRRIDALARAMEDKVDLTVLVIHNGTQASLALAKAAPTLDVVVCGHTNEITEKPIVTDTGALIVTVGRAGQWVGTLDLTVDRDIRQVARYRYELVPMDHAKIKPDPKVAQLIDDLDRQWTNATPVEIGTVPK